MYLLCIDSGRSVSTETSSYKSLNPYCPIIPQTGFQFISARAAHTHTIGRFPINSSSDELLSWISYCHSHYLGQLWESSYCSDIQSLTEWFCALWAKEPASITGSCNKLTSFVDQTQMGTHNTHWPVIYITPLILSTLPNKYYWLPGKNSYSAHFSTSFPNNRVLRALILRIWNKILISGTLM